ncbi:MAG: hypothetical protein C4583_11095 [Anaerolineaceae bacterium]|nr:MAG: hypothetical protein C4583_11095 [Anaerolineaceae bacterium]
MDRASLFHRLLPTLPEGRIVSVHIGMYWTAVLAEVDGETRCGLAATVSDDSHHYTTEPSLELAGHLHELSSRELADFVHSPILPEVSVGLAAVNALLPRQPDLWVDLHSKEVLARLGVGKTVVMVGHFPYVPELRAKVGKLVVLEQNPHEDDLPASAAPEIIPQADVLAITAMTLLNRTFDDLIALKRAGIPTLIVGPTTPLSPILFDMGATILSGSIVESPESVLRGLMQGANFHQLRQMGVRLVSMTTEPSLLQSK